MQRFESKETEAEFISSLKFIFPIEHYTECLAADIERALSVTERNREGGSYLFWEKESTEIIAVIYGNEQPRDILKGFRLAIINKPQIIDLSFGNYFCKVFNDDLKLVPSQQRNAELWLSLRQTQFRRAIAKFSAFSTEPMIKWMQTVENSTNLTYENTPFTFCLFMTKQKEWIQTPLGNNFISFPQSINFQNAVNAEKWLRGAMSGKTVGMAGYGHSGNLFGIFAIPDNSNSNIDTLLSPHDDIIPIINLLVKGTCMFLTTENGDIYLILPNKATFYKTQGKWHYLNYSNIHIVLSQLLNESVAASILRLALNLSYERHGALILIPDDITELTQIVPDYDKKGQVNEILRRTVRGLSITDKVKRDIIKSSAKIDGALVLSQLGYTIDVACMIGQPSQSKLSDMKINELQRFSGARSTAAWNASVYGTAIKVSEDGPITIFRHGRIIAKVG